MLPAQREKFGASSVRAAQEDFPASDDAPNLRYRNSCDPRRDSFARRCGEEEFIIFSPMQGELEINLLPVPA